MIILPNEPTDEMIDKGIESYNETITVTNLVKNIFKAMADSASSPWIKIEGSETEPPEHIPLAVVVGGVAQTELWCLTTSDGLEGSIMWHSMSEHGWSLLMIGPRDHPTHFTIPVIPEFPKEK